MRKQRDCFQLVASAGRGAWIWASAREAREMRALALLLPLALLGAAPAPRGAAVGSPAPALTLTNLDGKPLPAARPMGKVTVLNFWATWCPPCRAETSGLVAAYARLHPQGVDFLGVDTTETGPIVKTFLSAKGVPYPSALAGPGVYNAYGIAYIPTTIVLDPGGIVRARWVGTVTPAQLAQYVAAARARRSSADVSRAQAEIDALLPPRRYRFTGTDAERSAAVAAVNRAIARAEAIARRAEATVDYERTQHAEGALLVTAGTAVRAHTATAAQRAAGLVMFAQGSGDLNRWDDAAWAYRAALRITPDAPILVAALSRAYYRLHHYAQMIAQAQRYTRLKPRNGDGWADLGLAYQRARRFRDAAPAYDKALELLRADAAKNPAPDLLADVADTALDAANVYVSLGDEAGARRTFAVANAYADRLAPRGEFAALKRNVKERTQEGLIAAALARGTGKPVISVVPWTGPDLPGSLASTLKYRLIVAAHADRAVTLQAQGLRPHWVASFCADGLCSPQTVSFNAPAGGVKTFEFQLVPPHDGDRPGNVASAVGGGASVAVPPAGTAH
jgi:cytochrome c-type biogenesis protein CcmH/NrfG/thiol-disulfide isomerase/thioredoxin